MLIVWRGLRCHSTTWPPLHQGSAARTYVSVGWGTSSGSSASTSAMTSATWVLLRNTRVATCVATRSSMSHESGGAPTSAFQALCSVFAFRILAVMCSLRWAMPPCASPGVRHDTCLFHAAVVGVWGEVGYVALQLSITAGTPGGWLQRRTFIPVVRRQRAGARRRSKAHRARHCCHNNCGGHEGGKSGSKDPNKEQAAAAAAQTALATWQLWLLLGPVRPLHVDIQYTQRGCKSEDAQIGVPQWLAAACNAHALLRDVGRAPSHIVPPWVTATAV